MCAQNYKYIYNRYVAWSFRVLLTEIICMCILYLGKIESRGFTKINISHDPVSHHIDITIYIYNTDVYWSPVIVIVAVMETDIEKVTVKKIGNRNSHSSSNSNTKSDSHGDSDGDRIIIVLVRAIAGIIAIVIAAVTRKGIVLVIVLVIVIVKGKVKR